MSENNRYQCCKTIEWAVETDFLVLFRKETNEKFILKYPEAALWDFLSREIPMFRIINMIAAIKRTDNLSAKEWVFAQIKIWLDQGLLISG